MKDIKDFQERYNRWKNGERYWDIRGIDLPKYDTGKYVTIKRDDGSVYNVNPNVANSSEITVTTPEIEIVAQKPQWMINRDNQIGQIIPTQYTLRESNYPLSSSVDKFIDKYKYKTNNIILSGLANAADDWRKDRSPLRAVSRFFGWYNPVVSVGTAMLDNKLNMQSNSPKLIIPEMIMDYGNRYGSAVRGYNHLMSENGIYKTQRLYDELRNSSAIYDKNFAGKFYNFITSGIGDVADLMLINGAMKHVPGDIGKIKVSDNFYNTAQNVANQLDTSIQKLRQTYRNYKDIKAGYDPYIQLINTDVVKPTKTFQPIQRYSESSGNARISNEKLLEQQDIQQNLLPYINSWKNAVQQSGEIMPTEVVSKLRLLKNKYPKIFDQQITHDHRINSDGIVVPQKTLRHLYNAAKTAQSSPVPEGATKQEFVFAALAHDIGELLGREHHGKTSAQLLKELYPDVPQNVLHSINNHMSKDMPIMDPLTRGLHFADVASGVPYNKGIFQHPILQYPQINMPTNIGKLTDDNWQSHVENILNPILKRQGYEPLDVTSNYSDVRDKLLKYIKQNNTFLRGVRLDTSDPTTKEAINNTRRMLSQASGKPITDEELRRYMVEVIPPDTGSGRRGQSNIKRATGAGTNFGSLYYSNSNETGSGYGASDQKGKIYKAELPIKDDPGMSLMDLWFANDFPLYSQDGKLNSNYIYSNLGQDTDDAYKEKLSEWIANVWKTSPPEKYKQIIYDNYRNNINNVTEDPHVIQTELSNKGINFNHVTRPAQIGLQGIREYDSQLMRLKHQLNLYGGNDLIAQTPRLYNNDTYNVYKKMADNVYFRLYVNYLKYRSKQEKKWLDNPVFWHSGYKGSYNRDLIESTVNIMDYVSNHSKKDTKDAFDKYLKSKYSDDEFESIMSSGEGSLIIENDFMNFIKQYVDDTVDTYKKSEQYDKKIKSIFNRNYKKSKRDIYIKTVSNAKRLADSELNRIESNNEYYFNPTEFFNKYGIYPNIYTQEYLRHPTIFTTQGIDRSYPNRRNAQHYIFFGPKGTQIFDDANIYEYSKGGRRVSNDQGDVDINMSHKVYNKGKDIHINPANRGKFNATKKRTGKTTEELTHSKNPLTRKRAIFALNASKWNNK